MNAERVGLLRQYAEQLGKIQDEIERMLHDEQAYLKTLPKKSPRYENADLVCDSLGYAVDDLDSVLANIDDIISTTEQEEQSHG